MKHPDGWAVKGAGNTKANKVTKTQKEAIEIAENMARNQRSDTKIHSRNGQIRAGNSYGIEAENAKLKKMYAELALENAAIKDLLGKL